MEARVRAFIEAVHDQAEAPRTVTLAEYYLRHGASLLPLGGGLPRDLSDRVAQERARSLWSPSVEGAWTAAELAAILHEHSESQRAEIGGASDELRLVMGLLQAVEASRPDLQGKVRLVVWRELMPEPARD